MTMNTRSWTPYVVLVSTAVALAFITAPVGGSPAGRDQQGQTQNGSRRRTPPVTPSPQCGNGLDDDGDGKVDFPADPGCDSSADNTESPDPPQARAACSDGVDNDADGKIDYPADPGCLSATDTDETNPALGPGNAHRMIAWASYEKLVLFTDADLDQWKSRGVDGFVVQTRYLDEIGGIEIWTGDPTDPLNLIVESQDVHLRQRTLRDNQFAQRCHARGLSVYLGFYLSNYHNLSTPLKVWNDDPGWTELIPIVRGAAGAAKLLGMDGIATDSENYRSDSQTWNWDYPGVTQNEATVRSLARQRGRAFMDAVLGGFPNVEIINYRLEVPGSWEEKVQEQVNHVVGIWNKSVFPDFWGGIVDAGGFSAIYFLDPIFYKSWHIRSGWDEALAYNVSGVRQTLSQRWANWEYASPRFFLSPFAWIDPGPSPGSFDDARPLDYVAAQLDAFHRWGQGNTFGLYTQHIDDFDYTPYVPAMQTASTPDSTHAIAVAASSDAAIGATGRVSRIERTDRLPTVSSGPTSLRLERVAGGLIDPTDIAFSPDGRLFIAERAGTVRIVRDGRLSPADPVRVDNVWTDGGNGLLAIAIDPQFLRTRFVYVIYTAASHAGEPVFRLARFREVNGTLGERAVQLDSVPAAPMHAGASLRFGPDGKLYAAFDAAGDSRRIGDLGSYNGKILRLSGDGGTPVDQPMATPVYAYGYSFPRGLEWTPETGALWVAGTDSQNRGQVRIAEQNEVVSVFGARGTSNPVARTANLGAMTFYRGDLFPSLRGDLLVAGGDDPTLTRLKFDSDNTRAILTEPLLTNVGGVISALAVSAEGAIYFCVNGELMRLVPGR